MKTTRSRQLIKIIALSALAFTLAASDGHAFGRKKPESTPETSTPDAGPRPDTLPRPNGGRDRDNEREAQDGYKGTVGIFCLSDKNEMVVMSPELLEDPRFERCAQDYFREIISKVFSETPPREPGEGGARPSESEIRLQQFQKAYESFARIIRTMARSNEEGARERR